MKRFDKILIYIMIGVSLISVYVSLYKQIKTNTACIKHITEILDIMVR